MLQPVNPLLDFSGLPRFAELKPEHVAPAIDQLLAEGRATVAAVAHGAATTVAADQPGGLDRLGRAAIVAHLHVQRNRLARARPHGVGRDGGLVHHHHVQRREDGDVLAVRSPAAVGAAEGPLLVLAVRSAGPRPRLSACCSSTSERRIAA